MEIQGIAYPLELTPDGGLKVAIGADLIRSHIRSWLETEPFERLGAVDYGTPDYTFNAEPQFGGILLSLQTALTTNVPQSTFDVQGNLNASGEALINIYWSLRGIPQDPLSFEVSP